MSAQDLLNDFDTELSTLEATYATALGLRSTGDLEITDLDYLVEGMALHVYAAFQAFLGSLFLEILADASGLGTTRSRLRSMSVEHAREVLYGDDDMLDWLPLKVILTRSDRLLEDGQPFVRLRFRPLETLESLRLARNRIAHHGERARKLYEDKVMRTERSFARPSRWLMHRKPHEQADNLSKAVSTLRAVATAVATDEPDLDTLLGPAMLVPPETGAPAGSYECNAGGHIVTLTTAGGLPSCPQCAPQTTSETLWRLVGLQRPHL